jgi:hypothetical protein
MIDGNRVEICIAFLFGGQKRDFQRQDNRRVGRVLNANISAKRYEPVGVGNPLPTGMLRRQGP